MVINEGIRLEESKYEKLAREIMSSFVARRIEGQKELDIILYKSFREGEDILFDSLKIIEVGSHYVFPEAGGNGTITSIRKPSVRHDEMFFETTFSRGAVLKRHSHSDSDEIIKVPEHKNPTEFVFTVITGSDKEGDLKSHVLMSGEFMAIPAGVPHQVSNASKKPAKLNVKFTKKC